MRSLNLDQLRALIEVVELGSFSAAARRLNLTQPAISLQIRELERRFGLVGGNIMHGELAPDQTFFLRPIFGYADYRTPIDGLFMCGSGTHPGGGVMGVPGRNCAKVVTRAARRERRTEPLARLRGRSS